MIALSAYEKKMDEQRLPYTRVKHITPDIVDSCDFACWDPIVGCIPASKGCLHCWAIGPATRIAPDTVRDGRWSGVVCVNNHALDLAQLSPGTVVAVCQLGDLFAPCVGDAMITRVLSKIQRHPELKFRLCTKHPSRARGLLGTAPFPKLYLGVSAENQKTADARVPELLRCTTVKGHFLSAKPLLGPLRLRWAMKWVVISAEEGPIRRPCDPQWIRDLVEDGGKIGARIVLPDAGPVGVSPTGETILVDLTR